MADKTAREAAQKNIAENRKAFHDYHVLETFEAGEVGAQRDRNDHGAVFLLVRLEDRDDPAGGREGSVEGRARRSDRVR